MVAEGKAQAVENFRIGISRYLIFCDGSASVHLLFWDRVGISFCCISRMSPRFIWVRDGFGKILDAIMW